MSVSIAKTEQMFESIGSDNLLNSKSRKRSHTDISPKPKQENPGRTGFASDFEEMMLRRKQINKMKRCKADDSAASLAVFEERINDLVSRMLKAAAKDRELNSEGKAALNKIMMIDEVKNMLLTKDRFEQILDSNFLEAVAHWLSPLPSKVLPSLAIRTVIIQLLSDFYQQLDTQYLKRCGLGRAIMFLSNHPKETFENKTNAKILLEVWMKPIFAGRMEERIPKQKITKETSLAKPKKQRKTDEDVKIPKARIDKNESNSIRSESKHTGFAFTDIKSRSNIQDRLTKISKVFKERSKVSGLSSITRVSTEERKI
uniref:TFIIS N-terminal domain-containing protein n=1 Tax=Rhabditophanes sp. KR3021 TaxID=114890 RepID=A0AC35TLP4_9BILA